VPIFAVNLQGNSPPTGAASFLLEVQGLTMSKGRFSESQLSDYNRDGFYIYKNLFDREEIELLARAAKEDRELDRRSFQRDDGTGADVRLSLWNHPGDGIYGMFARCRRVVESVEQLLRDEAYHYHSKMIMKDAKVGGAWAWLQDYGYWYENGVLYPDLVSVYIAVDPATKENGCMKVLTASHKLGRIDHVQSGQQAGADMDRVREIEKRLPLLYCEMAPGDAMFFHANLLHASDRNNSHNPRWGMICCYNAKHNDPFKEGRHPGYTPLEKVGDDAIKRVGVTRFSDTDAGVAWLAGKDANTAAALAQKQALKAKD
jgi:ectoine hydroxylase-related dioxygenase (phytanoyl-CoA dioxygenase family)